MRDIEKLSFFAKAVFASMVSFALVCLLMAVSGCSHFQYNDPGGGIKVAGVTASPGATAIGLAEAEFIRADAEATRICASSPEKCQAMALARTSGWYGNSFMDTPYGFTWAGIQAVRGNNGFVKKSAEKEQKSDDTIEKALKEIKIRVKGMDKAQDVFFQGLKKGK